MRNNNMKIDRLDGIAKSSVRRLELNKYKIKYYHTK